MKEMPYGQGGKLLWAGGGFIPPTESAGTMVGEEREAEGFILEAAYFFGGGGVIGGKNSNHGTERITQGFGI